MMKLHLIEKITIVLLVFFSVNIHANEADNSAHRQHEAHVHGEAKLNISIDKKILVFELSTPALNVLGFEHEPRTHQEKERVNKVNKILSAYENVISIPNLNCEQTQVEIISPYADEAIQANNGHKHEHHEEGHSEYYLSHSLTCKDMNRLEYVEVTLFDNFEGFENIKAIWINQTGAGSSEITKDKKIIKIK